MEEQALLNAMFKEATLGILVANTKGAIVKVNRLAEQQFGYKASELIGQSIDILVPDSYQKGHHHHRNHYHQHPTPRTVSYTHLTLPTICSV